MMSQTHALEADHQERQFQRRTPLEQRCLSRLRVLRSVQPFALLMLSLTKGVGSLIAQDDFVGAKACEPCHSDHFKTQSQSNHAKTLHRAAELAEFGRLADGKGVQLGDSPFSRSSFRNGESEYFVDTWVGDNRKTIPIQWVFGANVQGVTFVSRLPDEQFLEHRMSYYTKRNGFDITVGHNRRPVRSLDEAIGRLIPTEEVTRCFSCHATQVTKASAGPDLSTLVPGVTCERCHGPGAKHIAAIKSGSGKVAIRNPGKLSGNELVWMCGECHRNEPPAGTSRSDPTVTRFQAVGLQLSGCFQESNGAITCTTCHNPHQDIR